MKGLIQVAGITEEEARMLVEAGVQQLGFPLRLAVHSEEISEDRAAEIIRSLERPAAAVLITYLNRAQDVLSLCTGLGVEKVQLHSDVAVAEVAGLRKLAPRMFIIKSLVVKGENLSELLSLLHVFTPHVDAFITDTYDPQTGACGATGRIHDWSVSRRLVEESRRPVILAGGLNPRNVRRAILEVRPHGVDVHTGVEGPDGRKDRGLVEAFVSEASNAFAIL